MKRFALNLFFIYFLIITVSVQQSEQKWFTAENNKTYYIEENYKYSWYQALLQCSMRKLSLLTIETPEEHEQVAKILKDSNLRLHGPYLWIGAIGSNSQFVWIANSQEVSTDKWIAGKPNNLNPNDHCLIFQEGSTNLNNRHCDYQNGFICEENAYAIAKNQIRHYKVELSIIKHG